MNSWRSSLITFRQKRSYSGKNNDFRACPALMLLAYAMEENNAKRVDVKITKVLPSSLTFPEAVEVPNTVRSKIM